MEIYQSSILALGTLAVLMLVQLLIADVTGILNKKVPGTSVVESHGNSLFRVTRTMANTNESVAIFLVAWLFCVFSDASPDYTAYASWTYVTARLLYAVCYYANIQVMRSVCFVFSLVGIAGLIAVGFFA